MHEYNLNIFRLIAIAQKLFGVDKIYLWFSLMEIMVSVSYVPKCIA